MRWWIFAILTMTIFGCSEIRNEVVIIEKSSGRNFAEAENQMSVLPKNHAAENPIIERSENQKINENADENRPWHLPVFANIDKMFDRKNQMFGVIFATESGQKIYAVRDGVVVENENSENQNFIVKNENLENEKLDDNLKNENLDNNLKNGNSDDNLKNQNSENDNSENQNFIVKNENLENENSITIRHPLGFQSFYAPVIRGVKIGDKIVKGQIIGAAHGRPFYFELRKFGKPIDPSQYFQAEQ